MLNTIINPTFMLQLTRPIAFIDLETTGVNLSSDRIVEIAIVKLLPDGTRQVKRKLLKRKLDDISKGNIKVDYKMSFPK